MLKNHPVVKALNNIMIKDVPEYGNKFFYSLGLLSATAFLLLIFSGIILAVMGTSWWLANPLGVYVRSIHLWATQAFVLLIILHLLVVFFTSGFKKPRRLTWVIGVFMLFVVLAETEFGYALRGDFSSQWRSLQGADFYNGAGIGKFLNPLNYQQIFGVHIVVIPLIIIALLSSHYFLVRVLGIAKPYKQDIKVKTVPANHKKLFSRAGVLVGLIFSLAFILPSPYIKPISVASIARSDPNIISKTLVSEFNASSDTATYLDNIDPYKYSTRDVYIVQPYKQYIALSPNQKNYLYIYNNQTKQVQESQLKEVEDYFNQDNPNPNKAPKNPLMSLINSLAVMAKSGLYESYLASSGNGGTFSDGTTYLQRFLADTGALEDKATILRITTEQYGMIREEKGSTPGAWWLAPVGLLNHSVLKGDTNGDRDAAIIFGSLFITLIAFPFIPYVNQLPEKLKVYKFIWRTRK